MNIELKGRNGTEGISEKSEGEGEMCMKGKLEWKAKQGKILLLNAKKKKKVKKIGRSYTHQEDDRSYFEVIVGLDNCLDEIRGRTLPG